MRGLIIGAIALFVTGLLCAQDTIERETIHLDQEKADSILTQLNNELQAEIAAQHLFEDSVLRTLTFIEGDVELLPGIGLVVPQGYFYLDSVDANVVTTQLWGNPPTSVLGMITPKGISLMSDSSIALEIVIDSSGAIAPSELSKSEDLLLRIYEEDKIKNEYLADQGYQSPINREWAAYPLYNEDLKLLSWGWKLTYEDYPDPVLNYFIRQLTPNGYIGFNAIAEHDNKEQVILAREMLKGALVFNKEIPAIPGERQLDDLVVPTNFQKALSEAQMWKWLKVAALGLAGLIIAFWSKIYKRKQTS